MADRISSARRSANMSRIRSKNTRPEFTVRRLLTRLGYRYRIHVRDLPGKPDIVFSAKHSVILVHGCFWHGHSCPDGRMPTSRTDYWTPKLERNKERDVSAREALASLGWRSLIVWECELKDLSQVERRVRTFLGLPRTTVPRRTDAEEFSQLQPASSRVRSAK